MYETHFGLRQRPFRSCPDSAFYYPATSHEVALGRLLQAIHEGEGLCLLTGQPGTGKTVVCHCLLERFDPDVTALFLMHSRMDGRVGLLQTLLYDLALPYEGRNEQELRLALIDFLLSQYTAGRKTVIVVDEAQYLSADLLEELRLLGNLEAKQGKALQVVLSAQPSIFETLRRPELAGFNQRLVVRVHLEPLALAEAADYLLHQLRVCGTRSEGLISDEAVEIVARGAQGVPRLLNQAGHQAFVLAHAAQAAQVDAEAALEALSLLGLDMEPMPSEPAMPATATHGSALRRVLGEPADQEPVLSVAEEKNEMDQATTAETPGPAQEEKQSCTCRLFASPLPQVYSSLADRGKGMGMRDEQPA